METNLTDKNITLSVYLPTELADQLKRVALNADTSVSNVLRQLLQDNHNQTQLRRAAKTKQGIFQ